MSSESEPHPPTESMTTDESNKTQAEIEKAEEAKLRAKYPGLRGGKASVEKEQEAKLRSKYPGLKAPGSSAFFQKRLSKGQKYFDSGDYNMAKAKKAMPPPPAVKVVPSGTSGPVILKSVPTDIITDVTGDAIPTPETMPTRKPSLVPSKLVTEATCSP